MSVDTVNAQTHQHVDVVELQDVDQLLDEAVVQQRVHALANRVRIHCNDANIYRFLMYMYEVARKKRN